MGNILDQIIADKRVEVAASKAAVPQEHLQAQTADLDPPRNFFAAVTQDPSPINVIAEIKQASPSAGLIREDFDPVAIAHSYHEAGAAAISCLTDAKYFQGNLAFIQPIKAAVPLPVLRKDFMIDPYQLYEARVHGADAVLLIAECLREAELIDMLALARQLQLTALVEVHDRESLLQVRPHLGGPQVGHCLLGINNRDLRTMTTDLNHTLQMLDLIDDIGILVSESGIHTHDDLMKLKKAGVGTVLVGEHLMRQSDPGEALTNLLSGT